MKFLSLLFVIIAIVILIMVGTEFVDAQFWRTRKFEKGVMLGYILALQNR